MKTTSFPRPSKPCRKPSRPIRTTHSSHYVLATALSANDQEKDALLEYRQAVGLTPTNPIFLDHLAVSLALNGDPDGAIEQLQKAIAVDPGSAEYRFNLAYVLESHGEFAERNLAT